MPEVFATQFSLVVATRDRPQELARLLKSLECQTYSNFEVIVVDQSEPKNFERNSIVISSAVPMMNVHHIRSNERGLSRSRNIGLSKASGWLISFPDDDCWYPCDLLSQVSRWFESQTRYAFLSGQYSEPGISNPRFDSTPRSLKSVVSGFGCSSVALFFELSSIRHTKLTFDEKIGAGTDLPLGEEGDFTMALLSNGFVGRYDPGIVVYHKIQRRTDPGAEERLQYEMAYGYVVGKHAKCPTVTFRFFAGLLKQVLLFLIFHGDWPRLTAQIKGFKMGLAAGRGGTSGQAPC